MSAWARPWVVLAVSGVTLNGCVGSTPAGPGIYVEAHPGAAPEQVDEQAAAPVWAPDGVSIAWATKNGIFRRGIADARPSRLSSMPVAGRPAWSPDGRAIAFIARDEESLVVIDADSGDPQFLVSVRMERAEHRPLALPDLGGPSWSPDGSQLAFNCWDGHGDEICVVRADGTGNTQATNIQNRRSAVEPPPGTLVLAAANAGPPAWSPDGAALAVAVYPEQRGAASGVFVIDLERGTARKVSALLPNSEIAWWPDGASVLVSAAVQGRSDVFRIPIAGGETESLTASLAAGAREPAVSPNGSGLAVASGGAVIVLDGAGGVSSSLIVGLSSRFPAWSPDGARIAFAAAPDPLPAYFWP